MSTHKKYRNLRLQNKGSALIISLILITLIIVTIAAVAALNQMNIDMVNISYQRNMAQKAAYAGICEAIYNLSEDLSWQAGFSVKNMPGDFGSYTISFDSTGSLPYATNNINSYAQVSGYNQRTVPAGFAHIISVGRYKNKEKIVEALVKAGGIQEYPIKCRQNISLGNNALIDGYDSSVGPYVSGNDANISILTDGSSTAVINLNNNSTIEADVFVGPDSDINDAISLSSGAVITGSQVISQENAYFPQVIMPLGGINQGDVIYNNGEIATLSPGYYGSMLLDNNVQLTLTSGSYSFTGAIYVKNNSRFIINSSTGPVKIYADSTIEFENNGDIMPSRPQDLLIFGTDNCTSIKISNNSSLSCVFFARNASVNITNNGGFYGGIVAQSLALDNNTEIHIDKSIFVLNSDITGGTSADIEIISKWND